MSSSTLFKVDPKMTTGASIPFFDRLVDNDPSNKWDDNFQSYLDYKGLLTSVMHEVYRILNTRRGARQAFYTEIEDDAVYFGLPALFGFNDFQSFDALNTSDKRKIITICEKSITMFEPRLKEVNVKIESYNSQTQSLEISISGFIKLEQRLEQIQFPMSIDRQNY